jgi:hypothetical protein
MRVVCVVYWLEMRYGTGGVVLVSVVYGGDILHLRVGNMCVELVRIGIIFFLVFFLYNRIVLLTVTNVIIFHHVLRFTYVFGV